jgi:hypothetical protein
MDGIKVETGICLGPVNGSWKQERREKDINRASYLKVILFS